MNEMANPQTVNAALGALFFLSELLALTPLKANSLFQLAANIVKAVFTAGREEKI